MSTKKHFFISSLIILITGISGTAMAYCWTTIGINGPSCAGGYCDEYVETYPLGIDGYKIVGSYSKGCWCPPYQPPPCNGTFWYHGYCIYDGTSWSWSDGDEEHCFTTAPYHCELVCPAFTGISGSNIIGCYSDEDEETTGISLHGWLNGTTINMPGAIMTYPSGIDGSHIVGCYYDASGWHGFIYDGTWTTLDKPGASETQAYGIDGSNIVGYYWDASGTHGFLYDGTNWATLDMPGASGTIAYDIDGSNIVGSYWDAAGTHGFLYNGTRWITLDAPGAMLGYPGGMYPHGIDGSNIVGYYYDASHYLHGFIHTVPELTEVDDVNDGDCRGPGDEITYTISYRNLNESNCGDVNDTNIVDYLPDEVEFISSSGNGSYNPASQTVTWNIGTLSAGESGSVTLTVKVKHPGPCSTRPCSTVNKCEIRSGSLVLDSVYEYTSICCNCLVVDDFESYSNTNSMLTKWKTGYTLTGCAGDCAGFATGEAGLALVNDWAEQRMRYTYHNDGSGAMLFSEARYEYSPNGADWTGSSLPAGQRPKTLALSYVGQAGNSADPTYDRMYVAIEDTSGNSSVYYNPNPNAQQATTWQQWEIPLTDLNSPNVNLKAVRYLYIGFGVRCNCFENPGGIGNVMFDNIRLCPSPTLTNVDNISGCVGPGDNITYSICYAANGCGDTGYTNVVITDELPNDVDFISATGNYEYSSGTVTWNIGTMEPNESGCVTVTVRVKCPQPGSVITRSHPKTLRRRITIQPS